MFGMFGSLKIKTEIFVETCLAIRKYTGLDLDAMTVQERGKFNDDAYECICAYDKKRKYSKPELICAGWGEAIRQAKNYQEYEAEHYLRGKSLELTRGLADYFMSDQIDFEAHYSSPNYFPPFFTATCLKPLRDIPDGKSASGKNIDTIIVGYHKF
jgi:hypothetical protein|tara:strand:+ start:712 stop:1179 length:468 start_codon:yes stop_codon:yes gene_type:complete